MDIIKRLNGPDLVVKFQKYFGVWPREGFSGNTGKDSHENTNGHVHANGTTKTDTTITNGCKNLVLNGTLNGCTNGFVVSNGKSTENGHTPQSNGVRARNVANGVSNGNISVVPNGTHNPVEVEQMDKEARKDKFKTDEYVITNKFFYYLFHFGANLGNEIFYITFYPFWIWNIDGFVGRRVCIFWALFMYLGQATKDILKIPRYILVQMDVLYKLLIAFEKCPSSWRSQSRV